MGEPNRRSPTALKGVPNDCITTDISKDRSTIDALRRTCSARSPPADSDSRNTKATNRFSGSYATLGVSVAAAVAEADGAARAVARSGSVLRTLSANRASNVRDLRNEQAG